MLNGELNGRPCLLNIVIKDYGMDSVCRIHGRDDGIHMTREEGMAAGLFEDGQW
jgi:hypothetical protein